MTLPFVARVIAALASFACAMPNIAVAQADSANGPLKEVQIAPGSFSLGDAVPSWVEPIAIPEGSKAAPLVVRLADTQYLVKEAPIVYIRRAVMINDAASLAAAGQLSVSFVPQYQRLYLHAIRVLREQTALDRSASSTIRFLQRETGLERGIYSGEVTASILVNDLRVGDTIEIAYSLEGQNPVFSGKFSDTVGWDQSTPIALRRVVLNHPASRPISWRILGNGQSNSRLVPTESTVDGMRKLRFEEKSIPEVTLEALTPSDYRVFRALQFSEYAGWDDVVAWASGLFPSDGVRDSELRQVVGRLRALSTTEERVAAALEYVQSEIRYFSVSLGESSHRPAAPDIVVQRRYGDCKDKSFLLMSLLREVGIESDPVLVRLGGRRALEGALPSPQLFDHMIVRTMVDGNAFYLDPTRFGQHGHLRRMGQIHEGAQVLVVAQGVHEYSTISTTNIDDLLGNETVETAMLPTFGSEAQFKVRQVWTGVSAESVRVLFGRLPKDRINKILGDALEPRYPGARMAGDPEIKDDRIDNVFSVTTAYMVPKLATERDGNWFVRFQPTNMAGALATPPSSTRTVPLTVPRFPFAAKYSIEITFPEEVSVISDPRVRNVENRYFTYSASQSFRGNLAKTTIDVKTLAGHVDVEDVQKYAQDLRSLDNVLGAIIVPKGSIKSVDPATSKPEDFAQLLRDRLQEVIDKVTATISSGKLSGKDLAESYCLRSDSFAELGKYDEAMREAGQAMKLAPNASTSFTCRAYVYFNAGEFTKAAADYSRAIALGHTESRAFYLRGMSNFYAGRLDDAQEDFSRASASSANDDGSRLYSDLWLSWTSQRLGKPVPEAVTKRALAERHGDWPRPALAMINGHLLPEEMLKLMDSKSGDERRMTQAEGYFYLGQHYLNIGDKDKAREYFEKTRDLQVIIYTEHTAARFELERLRVGR
jgi:lipoprotein NlpI/transglutaminase-like putative cysteine protease